MNKYELDEAMERGLEKAKEIDSTADFDDFEFIWAYVREELLKELNK